MKFSASKDYKEGGSSFEPGAYFFRIDKAEGGKTKTGKEKLDIDIKLYEMYDKKEVGKGIKYISFIPEVEQQASMLSALCAVVGMPDGFGKEGELVGKGGIVLVGWEEDFMEAGKFYPKPAFGGFGCWFSKEKKSATEIKDSLEPEMMLKRLSELVEKPYYSNGASFASKPSAPSAPSAPASTPETSDEMPF